MEYTEFRFRNFKGIGNITLPLSGDVTTLIGLNESGKTTILEAIFCFSYGAENIEALDPSMASLRDPERWIPISLRSNFNDSIDITAKIKLSAEDKSNFRTAMLKQFGLRLTAVPSTIEVSEKYHFVNSRYIKSENVKEWDVLVKGVRGQQKNDRHYLGKTVPEWLFAVEFFKERLPSIWYFPNFLFELPERFVLEGEDPLATQEDLDKSRFYKSTFEQILDGLGTGATLDTHIVDRVKSNEKGDQTSLKAILLQMGQDITRTVFNGWNRIFARPPVPQEVSIDAERAADGNVYLELKIKGPDGYYDLSERSLGFRWFFMFLMMTSYREAATDGDKNVIFLLDEPASNLHSSAQAELLKSFERLAETCHLIYTTHSHHMINIRWLDSAFVVKNEALADFNLDSYLMSHAASKTDISATRYRTFVAEHPDQTSYFQPVLDLLEYRPSLLEPVPSAVLTEGKSDFYLLRYFSEILGFELSASLVPGSGAGSLDALIRLYVGWGKPFLVLLDSDSEGTKQRKRYEAEFGPLLRDRCVQLAELTSTSTTTAIESLVAEVDRERIINVIFGDQDQPRPSAKKAFRQAILELYSLRKRVEVDSATTAGIQSVLTEFDSRLSNQANG